MSTAVGDEGGFAPDLPSNAAALDVITEAVVAAGYRPGEDVTFALDCAASEFYDGAEYVLANEGKFASWRLRRLPRGLEQTLSDPVDRRRHGRSGLDRLEGFDGDAR